MDDRSPSVTALLDGMFDLDALRIGWRVFVLMKRVPSIQCECCAAFQRHARLSDEDVKQVEAELRRILLAAESQGRRED